MKSERNRILIKAGRVVDPVSKTDQVTDVKIEHGVIVQDFGKFEGVEIIEAQGQMVVPGLIDMHVHLREPGREDEETILSGARAGAAGGFTTLVCMANTRPPVDNRSVLEHILERAAETPVNVKVIGAVSTGLAGECLSDMGDLAAAGAVGFSDDGRPVASSSLMRLALEYSKVFDLPIISHAEDMGLSNNGVMHEGFVSTRLGLKGVPAAAEEVMIARDLILAEMTGAKLHITHVSTTGGVELIRSAKKRGVIATADVTPHHLALTDENLNGYDANYKINPPLRTEADRQALIAGLIDGTIDAIADDHAPHAEHEKEEEIETAPCGTIGLQTTVPVLMTEIADKIGLSCLIGKLTAGPARILKLGGGSLAVGAKADVTIIDPKAKVKVESQLFLSKSRNSAFLGADLVGAAKHVIIAGKIVLRDGELSI